MFDLKEMGVVQPEDSSQHADIHVINDSIFSLTHRINSLENLLASKMDRSECLHLLEGKCSQAHFRKAIEQFNTTLAETLRKNEEKAAEMEKKNEEKCRKIVQKLNFKKEKPKNVVKPQELYLESNQTMFSMLVDEIISLKEIHAGFEKSSENRHRVNLSLNNQVCHKIQQLEREIEINKNELSRKSSKAFLPRPSITEAVTKVKNFEETYQDRPSIQRRIDEGQNESVRVSHLQRTIESLQRELASKINIKDIMPILKKNSENEEKQLNEIRTYVENAIDSTKKILVHQSEINQELCLISKIGWWHSFQENQGRALWNKEIANMLPEIFICHQDSDSITLTHQGNYMIKVMCPAGVPEQDYPEYIWLEEEEVEFNRETLIHVEKNTQLRVSSNGSEMILIVHKI